MEKPVKKPHRPFFSSGPCVKYPGWSAQSYEQAFFSRSHRATPCLQHIEDVLELTKKVLNIPSHYEVAILPGSATGAMESAMWNLLGPLPVVVMTHDVFSYRWECDVKSSLKLKNVDIRSVSHGKLPSIEQVPESADILLNLNGSTSGVKFPDLSFLNQSKEQNFPNSSSERLVIADITSAAFTTHIPWNDIDAAAFSWQKGLGGEAAHGMLVLSPKAIKRLETYMPSWPIPYVFKLRKKNQFYEPVFRGKTLNTPSMLCLYDFHQALKWAEGLANSLKNAESALAERSQKNLATVDSYCEQNKHISLFCPQKEQRSSSTIVLSIDHPQFLQADENEQHRLVAEIANRIASEEAGFELRNHPSAPPTLRLWGGPTVENEDIQRVMPWISWSINQQFA